MDKKKKLTTEKIGEINFSGFKTEFRITNRVKRYIEGKKISLASLLPSAWQFYEVLLFDSIDNNQDGKPDKEFGVNFLAIYNKITETIGWNKEKGLETSGFEENIKSKKKVIFYSGTKLIDVKEPKKGFIANYFVVKK